MDGQQINVGEVADFISKTEGLVECVTDFAQEYGQMVLHGSPLPPRAAEALAEVIRWSRSLADAVESLKKGSQQS